MFMAHVCFSVQSQGQLRKSVKSISRRDRNVGDWIGLSTRLNRFINKLNTASYWLLLRMNWAQANKYGYHLHIDFGIVVTDPFRSNLSTTMSSAIVSEGQHIVNVYFRDHFSLVLCYYWVVWISPLLSYDCWFFPLRQHGFFGFNSKLHLGLVFKIGFCFIEEWILDKKRYLWFVFGLFVFQGIQLFVKYFSRYTQYMYMRFGHVSSSKSHSRPNAHVFYCMNISRTNLAERRGVWG